MSNVRLSSNNKLLQVTIIASFLLMNTFHVNGILRNMDVQCVIYLFSFFCIFAMENEIFAFSKTMGFTSVWRNCKKVTDRPLQHLRV